MTIDGIWTADVFGPFGWESHGVFILENGRLLGGDHRQYSSGSYCLAENRVTARFTVHYYGSPRVMFGSARMQHTIELEGTQDANQIHGTIRVPSSPEFDLQIRLTRLMGLPADATVGETFVGVDGRLGPIGPFSRCNEAWAIATD